MLLEAYEIKKAQNNGQLVLNEQMELNYKPIHEYLWKIFLNILMYLQLYCHCQVINIEKGSEEGTKFGDRNKFVINKNKQRK